ncbi:MAG: hypothetical protein C0170_02885 [Hydrogenobaculum sp.]|nr:MAG: hypothetical protein C0170_02885 [Hydrogenobaculum sp.]
MSVILKAQNPKVEKVRKEIEERYKANLEFIRNHVGGFYETISKQGSYDVKVEIAPNGELNLIVGGVNSSPSGSYIKDARTQFKRFLQNHPMLTTHVDHSPPSEEEQEILHYYISGKLDAFPALKDMDNTIVLDKMPLIVVFGVGLGYHVEWLINRFDIQYMILVDIDEELVKPSLYTVNWKKVIDYFHKKGGEISLLLLKGSSFDGATSIIDKIKNIHPSLGAVIFIYEHYENEFINQVKHYINDRYQDVLAAFGFFDDEIWAIEHTYKNIKNKVRVFYGDKKIEDDTPVFIVGAGPSLDETFEIVKKYQDQAVIISAGTALKRFMAEGIYPDFHVEIERTKHTYDSLKYIYDEEYFKHLFLAMSSNVYPDTMSLFPEGGIFVKGFDSGTIFFKDLPEIPRLEPVNPTVANGSAALAFEMGFTNVYLFGLDLGFIDPKKHHSSKTPYDDKNFFAYIEEFKNVIPVKGNFRDTVYTEYNYNQSRLFLESQIKNYTILNKNFRNKDLKVYNTSDGAYIEHTIPLKPKDFDSIFKSPIKRKDDTVRLLKSTFKKTYLAKISPDAILKDFVNRAIKDLEHIKTLHDVKINSLRDYLRLITQVNAYIRNLKADYALIRGTIWHLHTRTYALVMKIKNEKKAIEFLNYSNAVVIEFCDKAKEKLQSMLY